MNLELIENMDLQPSLEPVWERLVTECRADPLFSSFTWVKEWWRAFRSRETKLQVWLLKSGDTIVGLTNLYKTVEKWGPFDAKVLAPLGRTTSQYVDLLIPSSLRGGMKKVVKELLNGSDSDVLSLNRLKKGSPTALGVKKAAMELGLTSIEVDGLLCPFLKVEGPFDDYFRGRLSRKHRNEVTRKMNKLSSLGDQRFVLITKTHELSKVFEEVLELDKRAWKGQLEISIFADEIKKHFFRGLVETMVSQNRAFFHLFYLDDRLLNYELAFTTHAKVYLYATAYDPQFRKYSPGLLARVDQIKYSFEAGMDVVEFGRCGYEHKKQWTNTAAQNVNLYVFSPSPRGRLLSSWLQSRLALRKLKRSLTPSPEAMFDVVNG